MEILFVGLVALAGSLASLIGGLYLIYGGRRAHTLQRLSVPFAAGALLAAAFIDLLPEAVEQGGEEAVRYALGGILLFFIMERGLRWFHHHHAHEGEDTTEANSALIVFGDTVHNFIDGLAIGAAFLVDPVTGIIATVAVAAHEIPQEIGDFGLLLSKGMRKRNVMLVNVGSAFATVVAATATFALGASFAIPTAALLAITAGFFIYIAASDIIPGIHAQTSPREANLQTSLLLIGVGLVAVLTTIAHGFLHVE